MRSLAILVLLALAACNTPTPEFYGVAPVDVTVDGSAYKIFYREDRAQAIRTNPELRPNRNAEAKITQAIEIVSGCQVVGALRGDVALANARVDCGSGARPWPVEVELRIICDSDAQFSRRVYCSTY
ncbi:MAG: hypothetical protein AAFQ54_12270 [Pseudomonadota bacterium]